MNDNEIYDKLVEDYESALGLEEYFIEEEKNKKEIADIMYRSTSVLPFKFQLMFFVTQRLYGNLYDENNKSGQQQLSSELDLMHDMLYPEDIEIGEERQMGPKLVRRIK